MSSHGGLQPASLPRPHPQTPPHQIPSTGLAPSALGQGLAENRLREAGLSQSAATTLPITGQHELAQRATHSRKRKRSRTSRWGASLETTGFPKHGDSICPRARQLHTTSVNEQAGTKVCPLFCPGRRLGQSTGDPARRGAGQGEGSCPSLWPAQGLEWSLLHSLPGPFWAQDIPQSFPQARSQLLGFPYGFLSLNQLHSPGRF